MNAAERTARKNYRVRQVFVDVRYCHATCRDGTTSAGQRPCCLSTTLAYTCHWRIQGEGQSGHGPHHGFREGPAPLPPAAEGIVRGREGEEKRNKGEERGKEGERGKRRDAAP